MPTATIHVGVVKKNAFQLVLFHAHPNFSHNLFRMNIHNNCLFYLWEEHLEFSVIIVYNYSVNTYDRKL